MIADSVPVAIEDAALYRCVACHAEVAEIDSCCQQPLRQIRLRRFTHSNGIVFTRPD
jgi:hypothetical protein